MPEVVAGQAAPLWLRLLRRVPHSVILNSQHFVNPNVPYTLEVGGSAVFNFPYGETSVLGSDATHFGILDTFGRTHYAPEARSRGSTGEVPERTSLTPPNQAR